LKVAATSDHLGRSLATAGVFQRSARDPSIEAADAVLLAVANVSNSAVTTLAAGHCPSLSSSVGGWC
jgi:hypothetical protein